MPQISLGKYSVSRLIVGCHDIDGCSHMSAFLDKEMHAYYTPERAVKTLQRCEEVGINAWQGHERGTLLGIYKRVRKAGGKMHLLGLTASTEEDVKPFAKIDGLIAMAHHGELTDRLFKQGKLEAVHECVKRIRDTGLLVGVSTHMPDVVDAIESKGWDLDYYQTCVYERDRDDAAIEKLLGPDTSRYCTVASFTLRAIRRGCSRRFGRRSGPAWHSRFWPPDGDSTLKTPFGKRLPRSNPPTP